MDVANTDTDSLTVTAGGNWITKPLFAALLGIGLLLADVAFDLLPLPYIGEWLDEIAWLAALAAMAVITLRERSWLRGLAAVVAIVAGYWVLPNMVATVTYFATRDSGTGTLVRQYLDERADGGARQTFVIQNDQTCETGSYVAQDETLLAFGIWPVVWQDNSQDIRDNLMQLVGKRITWRDVHDRHTAREMPILGTVGGTLAALFGADFTRFPNLLEVEEINSPSPCPPESGQPGPETSPPTAAPAN